MRKIFLIALLMSFVAGPLMGDDARDDRVKLRFGAVLPGLAQFHVNPDDADHCYQCRWDLYDLHGSFMYDYLIPNGAIEDRLFLHNSPNQIGPVNTDRFHAQPFAGRAGDTNLLWGERRYEGSHKSGFGFGAALDIRVAGPVQVSFAFQMSDRYTSAFSEITEYARVENVQRDGFDRHSALPSWYVQSTRHRDERWEEHEQQAFALEALIGFDVLHASDHLSFIPQIGIGTVLSRDKVYAEEVSYEYSVFAPELRRQGYGNNPEQFRRETGYRDAEQTVYESSIRGVIGATLEFYPTEKSGHWGIVADLKYYLNNPEQLAHVSDEAAYDGLMSVYEQHTEPRSWTATVGVVLRF